MASADALTLRLLAGEPLEMAALQRVLKAAPGYFQTVTGGPPGVKPAGPGFVREVIVLEKPISRTPARA